MNTALRDYFNRIQLRPNVISGRVSGVTSNPTTGEQEFAQIVVGGSTMRIRLDGTLVPLAAGDQVRLEQLGQAASAEYRLVGIETGPRPASGTILILNDGTTVGDQVYEGGDLLLGKMDGGNIFVEYATGRLYHRIGSTIHGIEYPDGSQLFGEVVLGGDWEPAGPNVLIDALSVRLRNGLVDALNLDLQGIRMYSGANQRVWIKPDGSGWLGGADKLAWNASGDITLAGTITAQAGLLGGWTIGASDLYAGSGVARVGLAPGAYPFYAGNDDPASAPFRVTPAGVLYAEAATIKGNIDANSGTLGALTVDGDLVVGAGGSLRSNGYAAGVAGWRVGPTGEAEFNDVTVRGAIRTAVFEKSLVSAFAGSQIVAKSASSLAAPCAVAGTTFTVLVRTQGGGNPFVNGDIIRIKDDVRDVWATVTFVANPTPETVQYSAAYQYGSTSGTVPIGTAVVDYGQAGDGFWAVSADGLFGAGAAWVLCSHNGAPWTDVRTQVYAGTDGRFYAGAGMVTLDEHGLRIGSLSGSAMLGGEVLDNGGVGTGTFGLRFYDSAGVPHISLLSREGAVPFFRLGKDDASAWLQFDENGLLVKGGITADSGSLAGPLTIGTSGGIYQGSTGSFSAPGTGLKIWNDAGVGRIAGYNAGTAQWYAGTDGKLYAGGGIATIDSRGVSINDADGGFGLEGLRFYRADGTSMIGWLTSFYAASPSISTVQLAAYGSNNHMPSLKLFADTTNNQTYASLRNNSPTTPMVGLVISNYVVSETPPNAMLDVRGSVIINEDGLDKDTRIEGDTDSNLIMVDASTDRVGIGVAAPTVKLDVNGNTKITGDLTVTGTITGGSGTKTHVTWLPGSSGLAYLVGNATGRYRQDWGALTNGQNLNNGTMAILFALPYQHDGSAVVIKKITVKAWTNDTAAFIDQIYLESSDLDNTVTRIVNYTDDLGNGSSGAVSADVFSGSHTMTDYPYTLYFYWASVDAVSDVGIYGVRVEWETS